MALGNKILTIMVIKWSFTGCAKDSAFEGDDSLPLWVIVV